MRLGKVNRRAIEELADRREIVEHLRDVAEELLELAADNAPVLTGTLQDSLTVVEASRDGHRIYRVGWDEAIADYGPAVELGTVNAPAQPHLRPAADEINRRR